MNNSPDPTLDRLLDAVRTTRAKRRRRLHVTAATTGMCCVVLAALLFSPSSTTTAPTPAQPGPIAQGPDIASPVITETPNANAASAADQPPTIVRTGRVRTGIIRVAHSSEPDRIERLDDEMVLRKLRALGKPAGIIRVGSNVFLDAPWLQANAGDAGESGVLPREGGS